MARAKPGPRKTGGPSKRSSSHRWSKRVMETSDAMDLETEVFRSADARSLALSLKRSAEQSDRRKSDPYRSAMSMLTFYINRAGKNLSPDRRQVLEQAKGELRRAFHRQPAPAP